ncbi:MAG: hypothetical protein R2715_24540 [Ilumatobacteraceae bacterium]
MEDWQVVEEEERAQRRADEHSSLNSDRLMDLVLPGTAAAMFAVLLALTSGSVRGWQVRTAATFAAFGVTLVAGAWLALVLVGTRSRPITPNERLVESPPQIRSKVLPVLVAVLSGGFLLWLVGLFVSWSLTWVAALSWLLGSVVAFVIGVLVFAERPLREIWQEASAHVAAERLAKDERRAARRANRRANAKSPPAP